ncbi:MAG: hypothetical protein QOD26_809 [Betaproteobacteria bacterium]|jgi:anti-sigma factor ChrR (cupin superfamily)|nr:hypothetical protein [Betaproteobacteria bacterium]
MTTDKDPKDVDARLGTESRRLLDDMNDLIARARLLLLERGRARAPGIPAMPVSPGTLGAVLYARPQRPVAPESEWLALVRAVAARDGFALHALGERTQGLARTLIERITGRSDTAEELTLAVLHEVWRQADGYDAARDGSVLGWIMNLAREKAVAARRDPERIQSAVPANPALSLVARQAPRWSEPPWETVAPGISVKLFATDSEKQRVSMLVRLAPGTDYPPHTHAGVEELHLLDGELWIDDRKLYAGDYNRAEPGTADKRVWSETGCACVLVTSTQDLLS